MRSNRYYLLRLLFVLAIMTGTASAIIDTITITSPTTGVIWSGTKNIIWTTEPIGDPETVSIYTQIGSGSLVLISSDEANDGIYSWNTTSRADTNNIRIRIVGDFNAATRNSGYFTIDNTPNITASSTTPSNIFKCGASTINVTFDGVANSVNAILTNSRITEVTNISLTNNSGVWTGTFGNNASLNWGNRSVSYLINYLNSVESTSYVFVYSDNCTGTNIPGYKNTSYRTSAGFGNYTRPLFTGEKNILEFLMSGYIDIIGYTIYIIILFVICAIIYIKTQSVMSPILIAFIGGSALFSSGYMPEE